MRRKGLASILGLLLLCAPVSSLATAQDTRAQDRFVQADANHDEKLSQSEFTDAFPQIQPQAFAVIDTNGDGAIDRSEWEHFQGGHGMKAPSMENSDKSSFRIDPPKAK